jgi:hypothetical protein
VTALLDTLPLLSVNGVDKVYHQLKYILDVTAAQQAQSSLQRQAEVSILSPGRSRADRQKTITEFPIVGGGGEGTHPRPLRIRPTFGHSIRTGILSPWHAIRPAGGMRAHISSTARVTHIVSDALTKGHSLAQIGQGQGIREQRA